MNSNKTKIKLARRRVSAAVATAMMGALFSGGSMAFINGPLGNNNNNGITVPDVNTLGLLDQTANTPANVGQLWPKITNAGNKLSLQQLGKAYFWDMQVGGDGVQSCASCHFHAGADHRKTNQMSPGLKAGDKVHSQVMPGPNGTLEIADFGGDAGVGLPVSEAAFASATADDLDGKSHVPVLLDPITDVNDVVSSQGIRFGHFVSLNLINADPFSRPYGSVDISTHAAADDGFNGLVIDTTEGIGFNKTLGTFHTVRRVEPRNTPTTLNAIYNFRNFWDGRADAFFNGRNPLGFRDPNARVPTYVNGQLVFEHLVVPFSSTASQAVGPVLS